MGQARGDRYIKACESTHMCLEAFESIIQVLELKIEKHDPKYLNIVPATALTMTSDPWMFSEILTPIFSWFIM